MLVIGTLAIGTLATGIGIARGQEQALDTKSAIFVGSTDGFLYAFTPGGASSGAPTTGITSPVSGSSGFVVTEGAAKGIRGY